MRKNFKNYRFLAKQTKSPIFDLLTHRKVSSKNYLFIKLCANTNFEEYRNSKVEMLRSLKKCGPFSEIRFRKFFTFNLQIKRKRSIQFYPIYTLYKFLTFFNLKYQGKILLEPLVLLNLFSKNCQNPL